MSTKQIIRCPNCGSYAERSNNNILIKTQCHACDYLMITCSQTGKVVEAYAPGLYASVPHLTCSNLYKTC